MSEIDINDLAINKIEIRTVREELTIVTDPAIMNEFKNILIENRGGRTISVNHLAGGTRYFVDVYSNGESLDCSIIGKKLFIGHTAYHINDKQINNINTYIESIIEK